jgi:hypothetical protein
MCLALVISTQYSQLSTQYSQLTRQTQTDTVAVVLTAGFLVPVAVPLMRSAAHSKHIQCARRELLATRLSLMLMMVEPLQIQHLLFMRNRFRWSVLLGSPRRSMSMRRSRTNCVQTMSTLRGSGLFRLLVPFAPPAVDARKIVIATTATRERPTRVLTINACSHQLSAQTLARARPTRALEV